MAPDQISRLESGEQRIPEIATIDKIATAFGMPPGRLLDPVADPYAAFSDLFRILENAKATAVRNKLSLANR